MLLNDFNVIVFGDMSSRQHADGRGYIGGNLNASGNASFMLNGKTDPNPSSSFDALYVGAAAAKTGGPGGNVTGTVKVEQAGTAQIWGNVDAFQFNNAQSGGHIYVGGTVGASGQQSSAGNGQTVVTGGNVTNLTMNNGGTADINGNVRNSTFNNVSGRVSGTGSNNNVNNGSMQFGATPAAPAFSFPDADQVKSLLTETSEDLAALAHASGAAGPSLAYNDATFTASGSGVTYYNITTDEFSSYTGIGYLLDPDATLVINVDGSANSIAKLKANPLGVSDFSIASRIIWNFRDVVTLGLGTKLFGVVLAPDATVTQSGGSHEGTIVAQTLHLTDGEAHAWGFKGDFPIDTPSTTPVPLPAAAPLLAAALGGLMLLRRRRAA
ncbi:collagen-binding domain-containing protein [uncultured Albimonas sp.]|mgnify:FL=1|uniref:collagen-binding domain-containing protein n=1 Tax=uncultured Albimonas sp. TaxID=1331701 RepID=UPI0030EE7CD6